jgi:tetratricopeptide (TPR) repeat protein
VNGRKRIFIELVLAMGLLVPIAMAQKPPAPGAPPSPAQTPPPSNSQPTQPEEDVVMFLLGRVATSDGTALPNDVMVERVCNARVRQQVYATSRGDFSMQMGSRVDSFVDASGDPGSQADSARNAQAEGIPRHDLANCELRASAAGFHSNSISLVDLTPAGPDRTINVGAIVVQRATKIKGTKLSATPYKAPANARKAYEKGLEAKGNGKLAEARKYFEQAVDIYPRYASAWFQLGTVFEKENQKDSARAAYTQATTLDTKFLPPYLALASLAYKDGNWTEVLGLTGHILERDPLNYTNVTDYVVDLDESDPAAAYFYNAAANYKLNKIEEAEKSARKAVHMDASSSFPQLHLLLAEISARKKNYGVAIAELRSYLELAPHAKDGDVVREQLAKLEKLNGSAPVSASPVQN